MAVVRKELIFASIFDGDQWRWKYFAKHTKESVRFATQEEMKRIMDKVYKAFFGAIAKKKLATIYPIFKSVNSDAFYGMSYGSLWYHSDSQANEILPISIEMADEDRVNLINLETGEIRQNIIKNR